jgi:penicillin-binding protein 1A
MDDLIVTDGSGQVVKRTVVSLKDTSPYLGKAFIAIEDERFYSHKGVDFKGVARAVFLDIQNKILKTDKSIQGASTITQQLVKNRMFLQSSLDDRVNYKRKIQEAYLSLELEKSLSKDDILEAYMNTIFLGGTAYGVEAASEQYFSKDAKDLTLVQSAFIAGIAQVPTYFYPFYDATKKNPSIYINKTKIVLGKMYETQSITKKEYDDALAEINKNKIVFNRPTKNSDKYNYEWFTRPVVDQIKADLMSQCNYTSDQVISLFMNGGLKIYTTMNRDLQDKAQNILSTDDTFNKVRNKSTKQVQSSAVIMDYHNGEVKAIVGGRGTQAAGSYNRAADLTRFKRPTGSSIKPLTVYGAAIDAKLATASTVIDDTKLSPDLVAKYKFDPSDDDFVEKGPMTIRNAIMESRNLVAVKLEDQIGLATGAAYAEKFGIKLSPTDKYMATLSLGQFNTGSNPLSMAAAYGVFGNSGMYATPRMYTKVVDRTGKTLLETKYVTRKAIEPQSAYVMYNLLKGPVSSGGTGPRAQYGDMPVAGKTGTTTNLKDLWFCGLTPYYSASVWIGNDDDSMFSGLSSNDAAYLWGRLMKEANANLPIKDIQQPAGVISATVCLDSGKLATDLCAQDSKNGDRRYTDIFVSGTEPTATCDEHVQVKVNKQNNKLATSSTPADLIEVKVFLKQDAPTETDDYKPPVKETPPATGGSTNNGTTTPPVTPPPTTDPTSPPATTQNTNDGGKKN